MATKESSARPVSSYANVADVSLEFCSASFIDLVRTMPWTHHQEIAIDLTVG